MKKVYTKPAATFESFTLSSNISAGCAKVDGVETNAANYHSCGLMQNGWPLFMYEHICVFVPDENDMHKFCYDVPSETERIFGS